MDLERYLNRIKKVDRMVRNEATGPPDELADKLGMSERSVYDIIRALRNMGAPLEYSRSRKTYYYTEPVEFRFGFESLLKEKEDQDRYF